MAGRSQSRVFFKRILVIYFDLGKVSGIIPPSQNYGIHSSNAPDKIIIEHNVNWNGMWPTISSPLHTASYIADLLGFLIPFYNPVIFQWWVANDLGMIPTYLQLFISNLPTIALSIPFMWWNLASHMYILGKVVAHFLLIFNGVGKPRKFSSSFSICKTFPPRMIYNIQYSSHHLKLVIDNLYNYCYTQWYNEKEGFSTKENMAMCLIHFYNHLK